MVLSVLSDTFTPAPGRCVCGAGKLASPTPGTVSPVHYVAIIIFCLALGKLESHNKGHVGSYERWAVTVHFGCHPSSCRKENWSSLQQRVHQSRSYHQLCTIYIRNALLIIPFLRGFMLLSHLCSYQNPNFKQSEGLSIAPQISYWSAINFLPRAKNIVFYPWGANVFQRRKFLFLPRNDTVISPQLRPGDNSHGLC